MRGVLIWGNILWGARMPPLLCDAMLLDNAPELCHGGNVRSAGFSLLRVQRTGFFWLQPVEVRSTSSAFRYVSY